MVVLDRQDPGLDRTEDDFPTRPPREPRWASPLTLMFRVNPTKIVRQWPEPAFEEPYKFALAAGMRYHVVNDPDAIGRVLLDNAAAYRRPRLITRLLEIGIGRGLLLAEGEDWRAQRRVMAPVFRPAAIDGFMPLFVDAARTATEGWPSSGGVVEALDMTTRATQDVITRALFSNEPELASSEARDLLTTAMSGVSALRLGSFVGLPKLGRTRAAVEGDRSMARIRDRIADIIVRRRGADDPAHDFLAMLMAAFADQGAEEALRLTTDNALTFFAAGHETTAVGLAWSLYLLAGDQPVQEKARAEALAVLSASPAPHEAAARLTYLRQIWDEALRLYPPAARIDREAIAPDRLCGQEIRKGDQVVIWPWLVHRHRRLWPNPDGFDPENFSEPNRAKHHRFQHLPFGAGPRVCIGKAFANAEAVLMLAHWLSRWRFLPAEGETVRVTWNVTLKPEGGLRLRARPVEASVGAP